MVEILDNNVSKEHIMQFSTVCAHIQFMSVVTRVEFECSGFESKAPDILIWCQHGFGNLPAPFVTSVNVSKQASDRIDTFNNLKQACKLKLPVYIQAELCIFESTGYADVTIFKHPDLDWINVYLD
jgi:hypothetical protein